MTFMLPPHYCSIIPVVCAPVLQVIPPPLKLGDNRISNKCFQCFSTPISAEFPSRFGIVLFICGSSNSLTSYSTQHTFYHFHHCLYTQCSIVA